MLEMDNILTNIYKNTKHFVNFPEFSVPSPACNFF